MERVWWILIHIFMAVQVWNTFVEKNAEKRKTEVQHRFMKCDTLRYNQPLKGNCAVRFVSVLCPPSWFWWLRGDVCMIVYCGSIDPLIGKLEGKGILELNVVYRSLCTEKAKHTVIYNSNSSFFLNTNVHWVVCTLYVSLSLWYTTHGVTSNTHGVTSLVNGMVLVSEIASDTSTGR